uniref:Putative peptide pheromone Phb1 n=1 Tax=Phanerochaete chrysosporium (strain RP-78 / ATCC MYA-4764 / FGSC 9002) TaxID=273507 RepID=K8FK45_PHACR|nr:TPA_inf: putative peptide pheromone Phb1 [Phanerochaete chrysosporium RP-78]
MPPADDFHDLSILLAPIELVPDIPVEDEHLGNSSSFSWCTIC